MQELLTPISLFRVTGVKTSASLLSLLLGLGLIPVLAFVAAIQLKLNFGEALGAGVVAVLGMFVSEWLHQMGHARAARHTGYPMVGIYFFFVGVSICQYPPDEPPLPAAVHVRRALGGFWVNLLIGTVLALPAWAAWSQGLGRGWALMYLALFNFFVLGLGALLPIDIPGRFTLDGGTLLRLALERWRKPKN